MDHPVWFEVAVVTTLVAVGNILFGHFEEGAPRWRRVLKVFVLAGLVAGLSVWLGRAWALGLLGLLLVVVVVIHAWWLPRHGINGWTGEPKEKYYELRGWKVK